MKQHAIITGGGSGIGLAIAHTFAHNDIHVILIGRDVQKLQSAAESIGKNVSFYAFDLNDRANIPQLITTIVSDHGPIDILVNNAGINLKKEFWEVTDEDFDSILQTNLQAVFSLSREVVKQMLPNKKGVILNISSMAAQYGIPKVIAYTASKSAIDGMTHSMAVDLSPHGIRVNAIAPGFIATDMSAKALNNDPERKAKVLGRTPMGFLGSPSDVGEAALFLCTDKAKYITGVVLPVDGGNSIGF
ncbi:SDR family NAD(P)-dependent oxidoreductase [Gynurincola endophyticus]|uniref:SDR family NAD(P)-dependent oxidoreductase n=1 Tax=Gynurincola endophyticus TaxID=2479004 RepID=UPI000F8C42D9|nr:SDR family oxidoreductase [Gynurincola endophyticus]